MILRLLLFCLLQPYVLSIPVSLVANNRLQHYVAKAQYGTSLVKKDDWLMDFHLNSDPDEKEKRFQVIFEGAKIPNKDQMLSYLDGISVDSLGALFTGNFALFDTNHYGFELFKRLRNEILLSKILMNKEHGSISSLFEPLVGKQAMRFLVTKIATSRGDPLTDYTFHVWNNSKDKDNSMFCVSNGQMQSCAITNSLTTVKMIPLDTRILPENLNSKKLLKRLNSIKSSVTANDINSIADFARVNKNRIQNKAESAVETVMDTAMEIARDSKNRLKSVKERLSAASEAFADPESLQEKFRPELEYDPYDVTHLSGYMVSSGSAKKPPLNLYKRGEIFTPRTTNYSQVLL